MPSRIVVLTWHEPGEPTYPSQGPGLPTNPIAPGGSTPPWGIPVPPSVWHPTFPTQPIWLPELPGMPVQLPVFPYDPTHPIATPPPVVNPTPPGGSTPPVVNPTPPTGEPPIVSQPIHWGTKFELKFSPLYGWILVPVSEEPPVAAPKK